MNTSWIWLSSPATRRPRPTSRTMQGAAQAPTAAPDAAPAAAAARTTGLDTPFKSVGASKKRAAPVMMPLRTGKIWNTVTVVGKELTTTPSLVCKDCGRAQLVDLRPHQVQGALAARPRQVGQARLGRPYCHEALHLKEEGEGAARRLQGAGGEVGHRLGQLRRLGRRARPGRLERGRRAARREGARAAEGCGCEIQRGR